MFFLKTIEINKKKCYNYYVKISSECIEEEELKLIQPRTSRVYHRIHNKEQNKVLITYGSACDLSKSDQHDLEVNMLSNSSVISTFATLNIDSTVLSTNFDFFEEGKKNPIEISKDSIVYAKNNGYQTLGILDDILFSSHMFYNL